MLEGIEIDLLLGMDFLDRYHAIINFSTKEVSVLNNMASLPLEQDKAVASV